MPFKSEAQKGWMFANKPEMAKEWQAHTPKGKKLPKHVDKKASLINEKLFSYLEKKASINKQAFPPAIAAAVPWLARMAPKALPFLKDVGVQAAAQVPLTVGMMGAQHLMTPKPQPQPQPAPVQ